MLRLLVFTLLCLGTAVELDATPSPLDDKEAGAIYGKLAEKVRTAKTVQVVCKGSFKTVSFEADVKATLLLKEGNKMRLEVDINGFREGNPYAYRMRMVSDGTKIRRRENQGPWDDFVTTKTWNESVVLNIVRGGFPSGLELARVKKEGEKEDTGMAFRPVGAPTDFALLRKDQIGGKEALPIEFKVQSNLEFARDISAILWLNPESLLPLQRMNVIRTDRTLTVTETYEKFAINEAIEDSAFVLPKE